MLSLGGLWTRISISTTTPKFPPPPPRHAQNRSLSAADVLWTPTWRVLPFGQTIVSEMRLSMLIPYERDTKLYPPPSINPGIPTVGHPPPTGISPDRVDSRY